MRWCRFCLVLCVWYRCGVLAQNCRGEEYARQRDCESICDDKGKCQIRAALLLPKSTKYYASLPAVQPVFDLALNDSRVTKYLPTWATFDYTTYDVMDCDPAYGTISAIDAYTDYCAHVYFGPACDYALASVARVVKFLGNTGTPLITTGGFTYDFVLPKQTCEAEYHMLARTGGMGFQDIAYFIIDVMAHFRWHRIVLFTEPDGQMSVAGKSSCHLMMKTAANSFKRAGIDYIAWDMEKVLSTNYTEKLKFHLEYKYTNSNGTASYCCT